MKKEIIVIETFGIAAIYEVIDNADTVKEKLENVKNIDIISEAVSELVDKNYLNFLIEEEVSFDITDYNNQYKIIHHIKI